MKFSRDMNRLIKHAQKRGWRFEVTAGGHMRGMAPDGVGTVVISGSPSDRRTFLNLRADFRRAGLDV